MNTACKQFNQLTVNHWNLKNQKKKNTVWIVHLYGYIIDIVWFENDCTKHYVKRTLIYNDGYNENIELYRPV